MDARRTWKKAGMAFFSMAQPGTEGNRERRKQMPDTDKA